MWSVFRWRWSLSARSVVFLFLNNINTPNNFFSVVISWESSVEEYPTAALGLAYPFRKWNHSWLCAAAFRRRRTAIKHTAEIALARSRPTLSWRLCKSFFSYSFELWNFLIQKNCIRTHSRAVRGCVFAALLTTTNTRRNSNRMQNLKQI